MNIQDFRAYCLSKKGATEDFPFDEKTLVFKVGGKLFALCAVDLFESVNLKCAPEKAIELREQYSGIIAGYHMSKKHWNTVAMDGSVPHKLVLEMIDESYNLVYSKLTKKVKEQLEEADF